MTYLRARYYDPAQARFLSRDTWEGNSTQPISYNSWAYANANPILYIDPTGHTPLVAAILAALVGPAAGFVVGAAVGGTFGYTMYPSAIVGQCGCEMQQQAIAAKGPWQFAGANALGAGVMGGYAAVFAEAGMAAGPIGMVVVGGVGLTIAGSDLWHTYNIIKNETGPTTCTIARLLMDVASMALSGVAFYAGVAGWRASGSWFSWTSVEPGTWGIRYGTKGASYEEFVRKFFNNPSDENLYVDNGSREVRFDAWDPIKRVLIDAKSSSGSSNYDFVLTQEWARVNVLSEAEDQVAAAQLKGVKVAWYVNNSSTAATLQTFFSNMNVPIVVKYFPGP